MDQVGVVVLEDRGQRHGPCLLSILNGIWTCDLSIQLCVMVCSAWLIPVQWNVILSLVLETENVLLQLNSNCLIFLQLKLTALNIEVTHWRIKGEYWQITLAVEDQMSPHRVEYCPVAENTQIHLGRIDILQRNISTKFNTASSLISDWSCDVNYCDLIGQYLLCMSRV